MEVKNATVHHFELDGSREYIGASQMAQQMLFAQRILESLGLKVKMPMILEVNNMGAIDLANNWSSSMRTKHINVRHHFLRELVDCIEICSLGRKCE